MLLAKRAGSHQLRVKLMLTRRDNAFKALSCHPQPQQTKAASSNGNGFCYFLAADLMRRDETARSFFAATAGARSSRPSQRRIDFRVIKTVRAPGFVLCNYLRARRDRASRNPFRAASTTSSDARHRAAFPIWELSLTTSPLFLPSSSFTRERGACCQ
jgi:hypothetical protein